MIAIHNLDFWRTFRRTHSRRWPTISENKHVCDVGIYIFNVLNFDVGNWMFQNVGRSLPFLRCSAISFLSSKRRATTLVHYECARFDIGRGRA